MLVLVGSLATACLPPGFEEDVVLSGLVQPMAVRFSPDGRVFVAEKRGIVKVYDGLGDPTPTVVLDYRTKVYNQHDRGLMSIALAPDFPSDPRLYVLYALDAAIGGTPPRWGSPGQDDDPCPNPPGETINGCLSASRLSRVTLTGSVAGPEEVLIEDWCQQFPSHSTGDLVFGPDGNLYASGGDGASYTFTDYGQRGTPLNPCGDPPTGVGGTQTVPTAEGGALRAQDYLTPSDPQGLSGSIIRIDPDTAQGAPGNPLIGSADVNARRLIAQGVRNPFRMAFRPGTGELWFGDVGANTWEEVNRLESAIDGSVDNFGWPCLENQAARGYDIGLDLCAGIYSGSVPTTRPVYAYQHGIEVVPDERCETTFGSSISGMAFYPGGSYPDAYDGALFFADYSRRCIWVMEPGANGVPDPATRRVFNGPDIFPVDLQVGPNNDIFYVDIAAGTVVRIRYAEANQPPTAAISAVPSSGPVPLAVTLRASGSSDPDGGTLRYAWDVDGDGAFDDGTGESIATTYTTAGVHRPAVRVTDPDGESDTASVEVLAGTTPPVPVIETPTADLRWAVGDAIDFRGRADDAEDGALPASALSWKVIMHHCITVDGCHEHQLTGLDGVASGRTFAPDHEYPSYLELRLTARDSTGVTASRSVRLDPQVAVLQLDSVPSGVPITLSDRTEPGPFTATAIVGSRLSLSVPSTHSVGSATYSFTSWSDGGARAHDIVVGPAGGTVTATFTRTGGTDTSLVAAYNFDDGTGGTVTDRTGRGRTGTLDGPAWSTGRYGGGLRFDGVDDLVTVADHADLDLTTGMTLEAWVNPTVGSAWRTAILKEAPDGLSYGLYAVDPGTGGPAGYVNIGGADRGVRSGVALPAGAWSHVAVTFDGSVLRLYVNGVETAAEPQSGSIATSIGALRLGGNTIWGEHFSGTIDDVRIYRRALTGAEISLDRDDPVR